MKSMTGFGSAKSRSQAAAIEVNVRSINGRFLESRIHLPREYVAFEGELRRAVARSFHRGTVDVYVSRQPGRVGRHSKVRFSTDLAREWLRAYTHLARDLKLSDPATMAGLIRWPEIFGIEEVLSVGEKEERQLSQTVERALRSCGRERSREGKALAKVLAGHLEHLQELVDRIAEQREKANSLLQDRYVKRLAKLGYPGEVDPQRLAQEIVFQLERADVNEEIHRLREHLRAYQKLLVSVNGQGLGKKLDFYTQELLREVNTIGSKSQWVDITQRVVEAKSLVERLREQVQNIE